MISDDLSIQNISKIYDKLKLYVIKTPLIKANLELNNFFNTNLYLKCEFLQKSGSFKVRGATNNILSLDKKKLSKGITAISAGNHGIAASFVSNQFKLIVTLEDNVIAGGAGSAVNEELIALNSSSNVLNLGLPDGFIEHGDQEQQKIMNNLDGIGVRKAIEQKLKSI